MKLSIRKKKAREKRPSQSDFMSDSENMDVMLGNFPRREYENYSVGERTGEEHSASGGLHENMNTTVDDFGS